MKTEQEAVNFTSNVQFSKLPTKPYSRFGIGVTTPSVSDCEYWICGGTVVTITNFLKAIAEQQLNILGDGKTTIANNASIKTNTNANKLLLANLIYRFTLINNIWIEDEGSTGSGSIGATGATGQTGATGSNIFTDPFIELPITLNSDLRFLIETSLTGL